MNFIVKAIDEYSLWSPKNCIETPFRFDKRLESFGLST